MGQIGGVKIALGLGKIDADAAEDAPPLLLVAVADAFAEDADDLFAVQQQVVGPFDLALHAVAECQLLFDGQTCQQRQGRRLRQRLPDGDRVVQRLALGVDPGAAQAAPPGGLVGGVYRAHRAKLFKMLFHIRVGAAAFGQITHLIDAHCCGTSLCAKLVILPLSNSITP